MQGRVVLQLDTNVLEESAPSAFPERKWAMITTITDYHCIDTWLHGAFGRLQIMGEFQRNDYRTENKHNIDPISFKGHQLHCIANGHMNTLSNLHKKFWKALFLGVTKIKTLPTLVNHSKNRINVYYLRIFEARSCASWLRHCATNQKGKGFDSTHPLKETSTRDVCWG